MEATTHDHSLASLVRELRDETTTLVRQEVSLAKAEMSEKSSRLAKNAVYVALGGLVAYAALVIVLLALRDLLTVGLVYAGLSLAVSVWLSPLIVGIVIGLVGWAMIAKGKKALAHEGIAPEKTLESLRTDKNFAKAEWTKHKAQRTA